MRKMYVTIGRELCQDTDEVLEVITFMSGMDDDDFGRIELRDAYSYVEVRQDYFVDVVNAINNQVWQGTKLTAEQARK